MDRRDFLRRSTLLATTPVVPAFIERAARAAEPEKDSILIVIELTGGNDGLNTVVPFRDEQYRKLRPKIALPETSLLKINDQLGLHPSLSNLKSLHDAGSLTVVQGVGYPNPDRSHFESMDRWHCGEIDKKVSGNGWLAKSVPDLSRGREAGVPVVHVGAEKLPMACRGTTQGVFTLNQEQPFEFRLGLPGSVEEESRKKLLQDVARLGDADPRELLPFVRRRHLQTYAAFDRLKLVMKESDAERLRQGFDSDSLIAKADMVARLITQGFGARVYFLAIDGFDTHSGQLATHERLMQQIDGAINVIFQRLKGNGDDKRTLVMTFSEFGRRADENGSGGTDHGSGSCLFIAGPGARGGAVGAHPSLTDLTEGDLKYHTDFRRVYATLLDQWLKVDSKTVLGERFEHLDLLRKRV